MNILVTGAAGFIGFHLAKELCRQGHSVTGVDNLNAYYDVNLKYARLAELGIEQACIDKPISPEEHHKNAGAVCSETIENFRFIKCDLTDLPALTNIFKMYPFDKVCNLAAQAGVRYSFENPHAYIQSNIVGFMNILDLSRQYGIKHFVYASSSSVYGNNTNVPFKEIHNTDDPQSIYAATKKADELLAYVYGNQMDLPVTGLRFFTVYGPWGRPDMAPFLFMKSILKGEPIKIFNQGNLSRDFSYIGDIITGIVAILEAPVQAKCSIYNIGNSRPVKLMDFVSAIESVTGKKAMKEFTGMQKGDVYTTYADTSALEKDYHFTPNTPLLQGIREFAQWYCGFYL